MEGPMSRLFGRAGVSPVCLSPSANVVSDAIVFRRCSPYHQPHPRFSGAPAPTFLTSSADQTSPNRRPGADPELCGAAEFIFVLGLCPPRLRSSMSPNRNENLVRTASECTRASPLQ